MSELDLQAQRDLLARELAELQWDLGGLAYEMAIRDHFRLDVLVRQAGRLQEVDARLSEVEHQLLLDRTGAAGACPHCGTLFARGALFCSQCAFQLIPAQHAGSLPAPDAAPTPPAAPDAPYGVHVPGAPPGGDAPDTGADTSYGAHAPDARNGAGASSADAPYGGGAHGGGAPDDREATIAFERPAEGSPAR